jgi:hypothetical protein
MSWDDASQKYDRSIRGGPETLVNPRSASGNQWFGRIALTSATVTASTALVNSNSIIALTLLSLTNANSNAAPFQIAVTSINPGASFSIGAANSSGVGSYAVMWQLWNPKP